VFLYSILIPLVIWLVWSSLESRKRYVEDRKPEEFEPIIALNRAEKFALNLGNLEYERLSLLPDNLTLHERLEKEWGIHFEGEFAKERVIYTLQKILREGSIEMLLNSRASQSRVRVKDMVAFDSARFVELIRQALALKILEDDEVWGFLFINAQRVQDTFTGWSDFKSAYLNAVKFIYLSQKKRFYSSKVVEIEWLEEDLFSHFKIEKKELRGENNV